MHKGYSYSPYSQALQSTVGNAWYELYRKAICYLDKQEAADINFLNGAEI